MNEEKRLDDQTVKDVSGGMGYSEFIAYNCIKCKHYRSCPYGNVVNAYKQLGGEICQEYDGPTRQKYYGF